MVLIVIETHQHIVGMAGCQLMFITSCFFFLQVYLVSLLILYVHNLIYLHFLPRGHQCLLHHKISHRLHLTSVWSPKFEVKKTVIGGGQVQVLNTVTSPQGMVVAI